MKSDKRVQHDEKSQVRMRTINRLVESDQHWPFYLSFLHAREKSDTPKERRLFDGINDLGNKNKCWQEILRIDDHPVYGYVIKE